MTGRIVQVSISAGGIPKTAVPEALIHTLGVAGDKHRNTRVHGGPRQAVLIITTGAIEELRSLGYAVDAGSLGENLTVEGLDSEVFRPGTKVVAGAAILQCTKMRKPCHNLNGFGAGIHQAVLEKARGGFYTSVLQEGFVRPGDTVVVDD